jgi:hypothetical protein
MKLYKFEDNKLNKEEYIKIHSKLAKLLRPDLKEDGLKKAVEVDWATDSKMRMFMTKDELFNALYQLADTWTPNIDKYEYMRFLVSKL